MEIDKEKLKRYAKTLFTFSRTLPDNEHVVCMKEHSEALVYAHKLIRKKLIEIRNQEALCQRN